VTLFGWDASDFDWPRGPMDLAAAKRDGISVFTHKATEGTSTKHKHYGEALSRARAAGIPYLGAYLVARSGNAAAEVDYFLSYVNSQTPWWSSFPGWFWQIDLEKWPYDSVSASTGESVADILAQRTGKPTIIYASRGQYGNSLAGTSHPLWNAAYGSNPAKHYREAYPGDSGSGWTSYSGRTPIVWQYGSKTTIGSQPTCDANAIRDAAAWQALFGEDMISDAQWNDLRSTVEWINRRVEALSRNYDPMAGNAPQKGEKVWAVEQLRKIDGIAAQVATPPAAQVQVDAAAVAAAMIADPGFFPGLAKAIAAEAAARMAQ
jgi:hypothetical protein